MEMKAEELHRTLSHLVRQQIPNFFRLYLNPWVAKACLVLDHYVREGWQVPDSENVIFLANSGEEALSGAIKLARFYRSKELHSSLQADDLFIDLSKKFTHFLSSRLPSNGMCVEYLPGFHVISERTAQLPPIKGRCPILTTVSEGLSGLSDTQWQQLNERSRSANKLSIVCVSLSDLVQLRRATHRSELSLSLKRLQSLDPQIVVLDESGTDRQVPFGAMVVSRKIMSVWQRSGWTNFHSTTFQPNSVASMHFLRCVEAYDCQLIEELSSRLQSLQKDRRVCLDQLKKLYSPSLSKWIRYAGFAKGSVKASGHYIEREQAKIFDGVAGVACSVRGHNPATLLREIQQASKNAVTEVSQHLSTLSGFKHHVPSVSGASAVEAATRIGLCVQFPRKRIVCLSGGFGGKTLLALTGTTKAYYKKHIDPLYDDVVYVDPFASDACAKFDQLCLDKPVAMVQLELIQGVGGVREIPLHVVNHIAKQRAKYDYLLFVDEVQTGMFRTGPFIRCRHLDLQPDLVSIGKATSDMMLPFAVTLLGDSVAERIQNVCPDLMRWMDEKYANHTAYQILAGTLRRGISERIDDQVDSRGRLLHSLLSEKLRDCTAVKEIRSFGLLTGIELRTQGFPSRLLVKRMVSLYLLHMLRHPRFPMLMGYCQYEPYVLKLTPPLSVTVEEIHTLTDTISEVLRTSLWTLAISGVAAALANVNPVKRL